MKGDDIAERLLNFAAAVLKLTREMPMDAAGKHVSRQMIRAATGGGSNYEEARGAESRADFIHKVSVATKEMREALYWLKLVRKAELSPRRSVDGLIGEVNELVAILSSSTKTAKHKSVVQPRNRAT
jgi:four helix bundle protein